MEKLLNPYDKEYMKTAMLKHEETFREQVYELHRLYQIQKLLMKKIASSQKHGQDSDTRNLKIVSISNQTNDHHADVEKRPRLGLDLELPVDDYFQGIERNGTAGIDDESELELTLGIGPSSNCGRRKSLEMSIPSDSAASFSSSSTGSSNIKRTNSGLINHQRTNAIREEFIGRKWGLELPGSNPSLLGSRKKSSDIEEQLRQDRHSNPPWLLQALSLNTS
ncbi:uncharacterized protein LOC113778275 [Coffea eugenioides]|uniref:Uncharacterized protein LOC113701060 n=1 Tax=Coffea arabica TaxID=13443 RepID=A0A6P6TFS6_COFAR|nr:uncharacterized protein LOC113701060 [Coffea arabica]XP_027077322.1 uncharacterized protein LOC113701060 [Coffea arabica]XP_027077323.1 uncharacterized protein LOC113701060 [Coffea arabica]XP_027077324.1 uncharacterized protein LOC113701060 [Coffea arabica]XP_027077325.1 uncharacterized protein LOC113701060 [Coffea arabica]XP_027179418.1 uncharacterized protein LOC113778275 [Coffea eugenioides]XP_027179419.1 uncharacterized protein LOC113778275 [Coffea eugenioides]